MVDAAHQIETLLEREPPPTLPFVGLDTLWLQLTGTVCNIACLHCFISCGPKNTSHPFMETEHVLSLLQEAKEYGVKEYYFTGGEPFMHPDIIEISRATLQQGPLGILTNGILIDEACAAQIAELDRNSPYSYDLRISLDGTTPQENDPIRGKGTFEKIMRGAENLLKAGLNPVFAVTTVHASLADNEGRQRFFELLRSRGFDKPRLKFIPPFKLGREERRSGAYEKDEYLQDGDLMDGEEHVLQCGSCRMVTAKGVYPCPILIEDEDARMGDSLSEAMTPIRLSNAACYTCHVEGFSCAT